MSRSFTLMEVMVTVVVILILATLSMAGYRQVVDNAYQKVCATNQTVLMKAVERHFLETGAVPATLGDIELEYLRDAYAVVIQDLDWRTKFAYFLVKLNSPREAYAQIENLADLVRWEKMRAYGLPPEVFRCPADTTPEISYGINTNLRNYHAWKDVPQEEAIIGDCEDYIFSSEAGLAHRHIQNLGTTRIAQVIRRNRSVGLSLGQAKGKASDEAKSQGKFYQPKKENDNDDNDN